MGTKGDWYEELCRIAVAEHFGLPVDAVKSRRLDGVTFPGDPADQSQIDLHGVLDEHEFVRFDIVVDAKWRSEKPIDKEYVRNWAWVAHSVRASRAMIISNSGFRKGAVSAAMAARVALLHLPPTATASAVPQGTRQEMVQQFSELLAQGEALFVANVITRSLEPPIPPRYPMVYE